MWVCNMCELPREVEVTEGIQFPGTKDIDSCELFDVGAGN